MNKKILALALAGMMLFGVLAAGCQPADPGSTTPATSTGTSSTTPTTSTEPDKKDYGSIMIYSNEGGSANAQKPADPDYIQQLHDYILENSGVDVQYIIPPNDETASKEKLNTLLASGGIDAFKGTISDYVAKGAVQPITELIEKYGQNCKALWSDDFGGAGWAGMKTSDGQTWGIPNLPGLAGEPVYLRSDFMKKAGLETPKTIDELEKVLQELQKQKVAGEETIPLLVNLRGLNMGLAAGYMDVGYDRVLGGFMDTDGKYKPLVFADGYKDFIAKMADWYKQGLIYKESFTINRDRAFELIGANRVAGSVIWYTTMTTPLNKLKEADPSIDLIVAEVTGPKGYAQTMTETSQGGWMIAKKAKNPEGVIRYIDWVQSDMTNYKTVQSGFENDAWKYVQQNPDGTAVIQGLWSADEIKYNGEFFAGGSFAYTVRMQAINAKGEVPMDIRYISDYITRADITKMTSSNGFGFRIDLTKIDEAGVSRTDMTTYIEGETVKFIMGSRPMSEWETFLGELDKVGLQKWTEAFTAEYNAAKG